MSIVQVFMIVLPAAGQGRSGMVLFLFLPAAYPPSLPSSPLQPPSWRALLPPSCPNGMCALSSPTDAMQPASGIWNASLAIITEHMAVFRGRDNIESSVYK